MDLNSNTRRPEWLTDDKVEQYKAYLAECDNPYTDEELDEIGLDAMLDIERLQAYHARIVLEKYGLM